MKVKNIGESRRGHITQFPVEGRREMSGDLHSFERQFNNMSRQQHDEHVAKLADRIGEQGKLLTERADIAELQKYRELISEFINEVVAGAYSFDRENSFDSRGRRKIYSTISRINEKLEEIAKEILKDQKNNLEILNKVDDIRGLILDIMM